MAVSVVVSTRVLCGGQLVVVVAALSTWGQDGRAGSCNLAHTGELTPPQFVCHSSGQVDARGLLAMTMGRLVSVCAELKLIIPTKLLHIQYMACCRPGLYKYSGRWYWNSVLACLTKCLFACPFSLRTCTPSHKWFVEPTSSNWERDLGEARKMIVLLQSI